MGYQAVYVLNVIKDFQKKHFFLKFLTFLLQPLNFTVFSTTGILHLPLPPVVLLVYFVDRSTNRTVLQLVNSI